MGQQKQPPLNSNQADKLEVFIQRLKRIDNNHGNINRNRTPQTRNKLLAGFCALQSNKFNGMVKARQAKQWLWEMDRIFETIDYKKLEKHWLAIFNVPTQ